MDPAPVQTIQLNLVQTLGVGAFMYAVGVALRARVQFFNRLNIPSAVLGGLLFALTVLACRDRVANVTLDLSTQPLFMITFFTTIGMGASLPLLKKGGPQVFVFLAVAAAFSFVQNFAGMGIGSLFSAHPLLGVMAGSVTLMGGPATGLAFAPLFEQAGLQGAGEIAIASATFGIVCGGLVAGPVGTWLIERYRLRGTSVSRRVADVPDADGVQVDLLTPESGREVSPMVVNLAVLGMVMGVGSVVSLGIESLGITLPAYIGAMIVAAVMRNVNDRTNWFGLDEKAMDFIGDVSLNIFLVVALMSLRLWELAAIALPLLAILVGQVVLTAVCSALIVYRVMGRDYDAAVMSTGFVGFVLGTTANALVNMRALVQRYGPAPRAFLVVPLVGALFIDFVNALIITLFLNWLT
ncbi:MAG: gltS 1 [Bacteroidetes bacterium]|nr:gltS 1 [Bacteroidota bacterium]